MRFPLRAGLSCWMAVAAGQERLDSQPAADLVQVDVLVTDRAGQPIRDLTADDFEIVEGGRPQKVAGFRFVHLPPGTRDAAEGRRFAIVVDDRHVALDTAKLRRIKEILGEFLHSLSPADEAGVFYTERSGMSQDFTSDLDAQLAAVDRFRAALHARYPAGPWPTDYGASVTKLRDVVRTLAGSPQARRAVLYVAESVPTLKNVPRVESNVRQVADPSQIADLVEIARRANVPVYTIDPRSLLTISATHRAADFDRTEQDTLRELAQQTGGRAFVDRPTMGSAVEEILTDNGSFYVLCFAPDPLVRDGKFHPIEVRVKRPDVRVRSRTGYVAGPGS